MIEADSSSAALATVWTLADACSVAGGDSRDLAVGLFGAGRQHLCRGLHIVAGRDDNLDHVTDGPIERAGHLLDHFCPAFAGFPLMFLLGAHLIGLAGIIAEHQRRPGDIADFIAARGAVDLAVQVACRQLLQDINDP